MRDLREMSEVPIQRASETPIITITPPAKSIPNVSLGEFEALRFKVTH